MANKQEKPAEGAQENVDVVAEEVTQDEVKKSTDNKANKQEKPAEGEEDIHYVPEYGVNVYAKNAQEAAKKAKKIAGVQE